MTTASTTTDRWLRIATAYFAFGMVIHTIDHLTRDTWSSNRALFWVGSGATVPAVGVMALVFARHRFAALVAAVAGPALAIGYIAAHLLPRWSALSEPYPGSGVGAFSWTAALMEISGAFAVGMTGVVVLHARRSVAAAGQVRAA